ncbi:hypothetical protein M413DRAFT_151533 [Hebeloma cylindrosporum]|uniref:Uncharacterized protein n=1 Tax=Hebeloma cylindrosporum TaxID=76867 RepID=A0A0C3CBI6_HEBCY|nr:hypothetical protein M413DRAFT_151533 [Hebeloma cylindrosporum h7]
MPDSPNPALPSVLPQRGHISSLPKELLLNVFKELYISSTELESDSDLDSDYLSKPTIFPYCVARVCKRWLQIIRSVPHFATRIVILVDKPISLKELQGQFNDCGSLLIKVFVIREDYTAGEDPLESDRVANVMKALLPNVTRSQVVVFDLLHNSSLPAMTQFSGRAPDLRTLKMKSRNYKSILRPRPSNPMAFVCPSLQFLDLNGRSFVEALRIPKWIDSMHMLSKKNLAITNLSTADGQDVDLRDLMIAISRMGHLTCLKLSRVELDHRSCLSRRPPPLFVQNLELEGLNRDVMTGFFAGYENKIDVSNFHLKECQLCPVRRLRSWHLALEGIGAEEDVTIFISKWDGFGLQIIDCPGVNNNVLQLLSRTQKSTNSLYCPTLRQLRLSPFPLVTVQAVKDMIIARRAKSDEFEVGSRLDRPLPMYGISMSGAGPPLSLEDLVWFKENLEAFVWDVPSPQPDSPILEADCSHWDFSQFDDPGASDSPLFPTTNRPPTLMLEDSPTESSLPARLFEVEIQQESNTTISDTVRTCRIVQIE